MSRSNKEVAKVFEEMADLLFIRGGDFHRARAFQKSARIILTLREPLSELMKFGRLEKVHGIGSGSLERIKSILRTGTCKDHERLCAELPVAIRDLLKVRGLGPRNVRRIYAHLRVTTLPQLHAAAQSGLLLTVPGISMRVAQNVLLETTQALKGLTRVSLDIAQEKGDAIVQRLRTLPEVLRVEQAGSVRRARETIKDLDFLVLASDKGAVSQAFAELSECERVLIKGDSRVSVLLKSGLQADLRIVPHDSFGAGMHYFTGSKAHNIRIRTMANQRMLALSEHGVFQKRPGKKQKGVSSRIEGLRYLSGAHERDIFASVGLPFIAPELREDAGEIEAAAAQKLPKLVENQDLRIAFGASTRERNTSWSSFVSALRAHSYEALVFAENSKSFKSAKAIRQYFEEVQGLNAGIKVIAGLTTQVGGAGNFDLSKKLLREAPMVFARIEGQRGESQRERAERVVRTIASGLVDVVVRPSGRTVFGEQAEDEAVEIIVRAAARHRVILGLCARPEVFDLSARACRLAKECGAKVLIHSDAQTPEDLAYDRLGLSQARRGWLSKNDLVNTWSFPEIQTYRSAKVSRAREQPETNGLVDELKGKTLSPELRKRLEDFLLKGDDGELLAALLLITNQNENALQVAFRLLHA